MEIYDLQKKYNNCEHTFYSFKTNFTGVKLWVDADRFYEIDQILEKNLKNFEMIDLIYLDEYTGYEGTYSICIYSDSKHCVLDDGFAMILKEYDLIDANNIIHFDKLISKAIVEIVYADGELCDQTFERNC